MFINIFKLQKKFLCTLIVILGILGSISSTCRANSSDILTKPVILVLGDSLSWVSLLTSKLINEKKSYQVINVSMSGDTTSNGLAKLPTVLQKHQPKIVIIELGANDGLRGLKINTISANLDKMVSTIKANKAKVLLIGMRVPPNYGTGYSTQFYEIFKTISKKHSIPMVNHWMDNIQTNPKLLQKDNYHPNEDAQSIMLDAIWPKLKPLL
jgi:acyl-CoA thioesterase-1